jgi:hypothetical protein
MQRRYKLPDNIGCIITAPQLNKISLIFHSIGRENIVNFISCVRTGTRKEMGKTGKISFTSKTRIQAKNWPIYHFY